MRTIAIVNQKGGCGKTTTAINLAAVLARRGVRTLLVDMDPQSHCAAGLGVPESGIQRGVGEVLLGDLDRPPDVSTFLWEVSRNLHLAPSTVSLAALEAAAGGLSGLPDRDRRLGRLLAWLAPRFDLCVVDCPPTIGLLTFNALRAADEAIVPVETGYFSLRGAEKQTATILRMVERLGRPIPYHLLATLYDESRPVDRDVLDQLRKRYGEAVLPMVVGDHEVLREAAHVGSAVTEFAPRSAADNEFDALAQWLLDHPPEVPAAVPAPTMTPGPAAAQPEPAEEPAPVARGPIAAVGGEARSRVGFATHTLDEIARRHAEARPAAHERDQAAPVHAGSHAGLNAGPFGMSSFGGGAPGPAAEPSEGGGAPVSTRAAELARRVRDLSGARPSAEELAMLAEPVRRGASRDARRETRLALPRGMAFRVAVSGDFNGWVAEELALRADAGIFEWRRDLPAGRYRYRLIVDGREALDPTNTMREIGPDGRDVSVLEVER